MNRIEEALRKNKQIRVIGFDDSPFDKKRSSAVNISGIVCSNTRFEGMLWSEVEKDGTDATETLIEIVKKSKFYSQLHAILLDGVAFGGFNIIDLKQLSSALNLPTIAVMRRQPNMDKIDLALQNFSDYAIRRELIKRAGQVHQVGHFVFQCAKISTDSAAKVLKQTTDTGQVPEALRLAHLIGSAIKSGESSNRA